MVYVMLFRFRLKRAEEEEGQGRGRREWSVFGGKSSPPLLPVFNGKCRSSVNGRKVRLQAWKRADGKERAVPLYTAQVPLTEFQLARVVALVVPACMCMMMIDE